jgi:putative transferase (TIGR04331 family)
LKNNLVIYPSSQFYSNDNNNIFVDRFVRDQYYDDINHSDNLNFVSTRLSSENRKQNFLLADKLFYEILHCIKDEFNTVFEKNFDLKFYEIIIGPWLRLFTYQFVHKFKTVLNAVNDYTLEECKIYDTKDLLFLLDKTESLFSASNDNAWNAGIYSYILENIKTKIKFKKIFFKGEILFNSKSKNNKKTSKIKNFLKFISTYLSDKIPNYSKALIYRTGFGGHGFYYEKKLEILLQQIPRYYKLDFKYDISDYNLELRSKFDFKKFKKKKSNDLNHENEFIEIYNLILGILWKSIPIIFVEDFIYMINFSQKLNFPKNPNIILTSFAHETIEPFKFYLALQKFKNRKLKYFIYQHGSAFITSIDSSFGHVFKTADTFITWGKKKDPTFKNIITHANFKLLDKRYFKKNKSDKILILMRSSGSNLTPYDFYTEKVDKINLMIEFLKKIDKKFKSKIVIRAHPSAKKVFKKYDDFFNFDNFKFQLDYGKTPYFKAINDTRLIIFGYDSSGILETIIANKPFVGLWPNLLEHLNDFAKEDYISLKQANIIFDNSQDLINHINKVWDNIDDWWFNKDTQKVIKKFSNSYSLKPDINFYKNLKKILRN